MSIGLTMEQVVAALQEADGYLSLVGYRYGHLLPDHIPEECIQASARCRSLIRNIEVDRHSQQDPRRIAYLFGPVSGRIEEAKAEFAEAQALLAGRGYVVWNPIERANNPTAEAEAQQLGRNAAGKPGWCGVMQTCFRDVLGADELWGLPNWEQSVGAQIEAFLAQVVGTPVYELETGEQIFPNLALVRPGPLAGMFAAPGQIYPRVSP